MRGVPSLERRYNYSARRLEVEVANNMLIVMYGRASKP